MDWLKPSVAVWIFAGVTLALVSACGAGDVQSVIETVIAQTEQISSLETAAAQAQGGLVAPSETAAPPTAAPTFAPNPEQIAAFPADYGTLVEQNGTWFFNDAEVAFTQHTEADGSVSTWLSLAGETDWPLFIQPQGGPWVPGFAEWNGAVSMVNTTDETILFTLGGAEELTGSGEPQAVELTPYEISNSSFFPPGDYDFGFVYSAGEFACTLHFEATSSYFFIIVPEGIALLDENSPPQSAAEVNILNSPLCID